MSVFKEIKGHVCMELMKGEVADAVLEAVLELNEDVKVSDLPGYIIIEVPGRVEVDAALVREYLGNKNWNIGDLNEFMPAYAGQIEVYTEEKLVLSRLQK